MRILCTFPGRYGDLLWALPAIRALSRRLDTPIDLTIAGEFANILPLLARQPYLGHVWADPDWALEPNQPTPPPRRARAMLERTHDQTFHLAYRGWPQRALPFETLDCLNRRTEGSPLRRASLLADADLDLSTPWITVDGPGPPTELAVGFTEAWFELKLGLLVCLDPTLPPYLQLTPPGSRWTTEGAGRVSVLAADWLTHARTIRNADRFFGDCSALHVLACALGTPVLLMEPMDGRWNDIFYPYGKTGPRVTLITGGDGRPTFDARHCRDAIDTARSSAGAGVSP